MNCWSKAEAEARRGEAEAEARRRRGGGEATAARRGGARAGGRAGGRRRPRAAVVYDAFLRPHANFQIFYGKSRFRMFD